MIEHRAEHWSSDEADIIRPFETPYEFAIRWSELRRTRCTTPVAVNGHRIANKANDAKCHDIPDWELEFFLLRKLLQLIWQAVRLMIQ